MPLTAADEWRPMRPADVAPTPRCSARFLRPFVELLGSGETSHNHVLRELGVTSLDDELPVQRVYQLLDAAVEYTQDESLGLKAGSRMDSGDAGVFDYLLLTSPTAGEALEIAPRYIVLLNDVLSCTVQPQPESVALRFESRLRPPAAAEDFLLSSIAAAHPWLRDAPALECWFLHAPPADLAPFQTTFPGARFRFAAPATAFVLPQTFLETPLAGADPNLHALLRELADIMLARRANQSSFADRVRAVVARELTTRPLNAALVARRLQTSARTLARKLEAEGTSFYSLVDEARRTRALELIRERARTLDQIAQATGFAHGESFHRAFRRWTGQTPSAYRLRAT
jgi:AraC-like DNA-binding protein